VPATPIARRAFGAAPDEFPELSDEVSAVVGAPAAGAPRGAEAAVPAQLRRAEAADDAGEGEADHTVVVARRRAFWQLVLPDAAVVPLSGDVVIVGRQPAPDPAFPRAQLVAIEDRTRTVSKTHARLELRSGLWHITDLHSTNGVVLTNFLGTEIELEPGSDAPAGERFLLGDAELRIERPGT
jgi:pSer/pThr/pTyr-binding forkhead associated (FHA) protein